MGHVDLPKTGTHAASLAQATLIAYLVLISSAMASSSGDDVPTQLAALLGRDIAQIRKTNQTPPRVSAIDVVQAITGKDARHASEDVRSL